MQCKRKYQWVKLPRCCLPQGKGGGTGSMGTPGGPGSLSEGHWPLLRL